MRTREIKVWVSPSDLGNKYFSVTHENADCPMKGDSVKARLIIELPEKKIEITESQFLDAFYNGHDCYESNWSKEIHKAKLKLFGREEM